MEGVRAIALPGGRSGGRGFPPALAASAAFHLLALAAFLSSGGAAGAPPRAGVVEIFLAPAPAGGRAEAPWARPGPARAASRSVANEPASASAGVSARGDDAAPHAPVVPAPARGAAASGPPAPAASGAGPAGAGVSLGPAALPQAAGPGRADVPREVSGTGPAVAAPVPAVGLPGGAGSLAGGAGVPSQSRGRIGGSGGPPSATAAERGEGTSGAGRLAHGALRARIQSHIVYPEEAVRRGQEGEVVLRIRVDGRGAPLEIRVARSSGVRVLDDAARRGVILATPLPAAPGWVEVPVTFRLE